MVQPWSQCIGAGFSDQNTVVARWTWDTNGQTTANVLYPEIAYGTLSPSTTYVTSFPRLISSVNSLNVKWNFEIDKGDSTGQILLESWLSSSVYTFGNHDGKVNAEVGVMLDCWNSDSWCALTGELVTIGGKDYMYTGVQPPAVTGSAPMMGFRSVKPQTGQGGIDMMQFINFLKSRNAIPNSLYIDTVEFGSEISKGKGEVRVNAYSITVN